LFSILGWSNICNFIELVSWQVYIFDKFYGLLWYHWYSSWMTKTKITIRVLGREAPNARWCFFIITLLVMTIAENLSYNWICITLHTKDMANQMILTVQYVNLFRWVQIKRKRDWERGRHKERDRDRGREREGEWKHAKQL